MKHHGQMLSDVISTRITRGADVESHVGALLDAEVGAEEDAVLVLDGTDDVDVELLEASEAESDMT